MITFAPLAATLHRKQISKTELQKGIKTSSATIAKISKDEYVSMKILDDICNYLGCEITEVISHVKEKDSH
ncbi:helix-turn-helix domain-containing protein [Fictibacillus phosphorivorans]|uniref:helix-turn-helix domain-containing protein n=1 Tax=Fictibacillus phosphorivorans TaxID=1221500 RepID=UPI0011A06E58|nr:helix-turn-helix transcriptional regulator [Fictibacillus phosphorivorans]